MGTIQQQFGPSFDWPFGSAIAFLGMGVVLMGLWAASPLVLLWQPTLMGLFSPHTGVRSFAENLGVLWLGVGVAGLLFRTVQLFFVRDVETGLVWATKILSDPFNDFRIYCKAPGQMVKQMVEVRRNRAV